MKTLKTEGLRGVSELFKVIDYRVTLKLLEPLWYSLKYFLAMQKTFLCIFCIFIKFEPFLFYVQD